MASRLTKHEQIRLAAEDDLLTFIRLVSPDRELGRIHEQVIRWWTRPDAGQNQLLLLPRDHQKSVLVAYRVAWELTRDPTLTFLYISATSTLAEKQLYFIKNILTSERYRRYWPEMILPDEGKREKWTNNEIIVDHPKRKTAGLKDSSIFTAGLTTTITGLHFNVAVLDDVVVKENAYSEEGRSKVESCYSLLSSIETTGAREWIVGTRYHPKDLYGVLQKQEYEVYDTHNGELIRMEPLYEVFQRQVEDQGDGTGQFIWPKQQRVSDGKWFGFDANELAKKRAKYLDKTQFFAQYYNNPNNPEGRRFDYANFQYYDQKFVKRSGGKWTFKGRRLNVYAAIDFAFSIREAADYTSIVVIGVDPDGNILVLDIDRFKTDRISEYFRHIRSLHAKWDFQKLVAEVTAGQKTIVRELKESYIKPAGLMLSIEEQRPDRRTGTKEQRIRSILEPKYDEHKVWHFEGGLCSALENELVEAHPEHDDIKDALSAAVSVSVAPKEQRTRSNVTSITFHPRFGGVAA